MAGAALAASLLATSSAATEASADQFAEETAATPSPALLVYTKTTAFRHDSIPHATAALADMARERGWTITLTEDPAWFEADRLAHFDAVVWALPTGDTLSPSQKSAFRTFIEGGGGYIGLHAAGDSSHTWDWYVEELIGARYAGHPGDPNVRRGTIRVEDADHPAMRGLPAEWSREDEWYSFEHSPRGKVSVLATLDETTYEPRLAGQDSQLAMGADHPIVWNRCLGDGRAIYSALGHTPESYSEPAHLDVIEGAISWALGEGDCPE